MSWRYWQDGFMRTRADPVRIIKVMKAYHLFKELVIYYLVQQLIEHIRTNNIKTHEQLIESLPIKSGRCAMDERRRTVNSSVRN